MLTGYWFTGLGFHQCIIHSASIRAPAASVYVHS